MTIKYKSLDTIHHEMTNSSFFFPFFHPLRVKTSTQERTKSALLKNGGTEIEEHERLKRIKIFFFWSLIKKNRSPGFPKQNARRDFIGIQRDFLEG